jgi:hypothetical protein
METCGPQPLELRQPLLGQWRFLATTEPWRRAPLSMEPPDSLLAEIPPPSIRLGPGAKGQAACHLHGTMGVVGLLLPVALGVVIVVCDGFEMPGPLVFFAQRVNEAHRESPLGTLGSVGQQVRYAKGAERRPQVLSRPGAKPQRVRPVRGGREPRQ